MGTSVSNGNHDAEAGELLHVPSQAVAERPWSRCELAQAGKQLHLLGFMEIRKRKGRNTIKVTNITRHSAADTPDCLWSDGSSAA